MRFIRMIYLLTKRHLPVSLPVQMFVLDLILIHRHVCTILKSLHKFQVKTLTYVNHSSNLFFLNGFMIHFFVRLLFRPIAYTDQKNCLVFTIYGSLYREPLQCVFFFIIINTHSRWLCSPYWTTRGVSLSIGRTEIVL